MQLWNDYEGRTVAEQYPLSKLLRPEGRSAFFSTSNGTGNPSIIRLIEAHFDESEILKRWKTIAENAQPNLIAMRKFGETVLDGTPLVYAVMEPAEATLSDVLRERNLTLDETRELAISLIAAIEALHSLGFVHEHIQPENIYAVGETVKLRSDCIREAANGLEEDSPEIEARKNRDVHDLVLVLLQSLTGHRELRGSATLLPTPFDAIVRNGLSGTWGLRQMAAALSPARSSSSATRQPEKTPAAALPPVAAPVRPMPATPAKPTQSQKPEPNPERKTSAPTSELPKPAPAPEKPRPVPTLAPDVRHRIVRPVAADPRRARVWIATALGALVLLLLFWYFLRDQPRKNDVRPVTTLAMPGTPETPVAAASAANPAPNTPTNAVPTAGRAQWRVVAYAYNHEDQAKQKAATIASRNPALNPQVFTPNGRAPYLVTLGGAMTHEDAAAFRNKAVAAGLPRDTYIQNYSH